MSIYTVYTRPGCGFCVRAKLSLKARGLSFVEVDIQQDRTEMDRRVLAATGSLPTTVPQIFCGEQYIGGFDQLSAKLTSEQRG